MSFNGFMAPMRMGPFRLRDETAMPLFAKFALWAHDVARNRRAERGCRSADVARADETEPVEGDEST